MGLFSGKSKNQPTSIVGDDIRRLPNTPTLEEATGLRQFQPLERETRPTVTTAAAAYYLNREPQTLRCWATYQNGPVSPIRIFGRLAWNTADLRRLLGVE